jgi:DNA-binding HxlR family transcriptional regulator
MLRPQSHPYLFRYGRSLRPCLAPSGAPRSTGGHPVWRCKPHDPVPDEVRRVADLLERRYAFSILYASHQGCTRFTEFRRALGSIPPGTLAQRLVELEEAGVLRREVRTERPTRVEYVLTADGLRLRALVDALAVWARA